MSVCTSHCVLSFPCGIEGALRGPEVSFDTYLFALVSSASWCEVRLSCEGPQQVAHLVDGGKHAVSGVSSCWNQSRVAALTVGFERLASHVQREGARNPRYPCVVLLDVY